MKVGDYVEVIDLFTHKTSRRSVYGGMGGTIKDMKETPDHGGTAGTYAVVSIRKTGREITVPVRHLNVLVPA